MPKIFDSKGNQIHYKVRGINFPAELLKVVDKDRKVPEFRLEIQRSIWVQRAIEFYLAANNRLPADYDASNNPELEVAQELAKIVKKIRKDLGKKTP